MQSLWADVPNAWSHYTHCELLVRNWPWQRKLQAAAVPLGPQRSHNYPGTPCVSCPATSPVPQWDFPVSWTFSRWCHKCDLQECHTDGGGGGLSALLTNDGKCLDDWKNIPNRKNVRVRKWCLGPCWGPHQALPPPNTDVYKWIKTKVSLKIKHKP